MSNTPDQPPTAPEPGSALALLGEILAKDREAIREAKTIAPWYKPPDELLDLHRRIEACLSANADYPTPVA